MGGIAGYATILLVLLRRQKASQNLEIIKSSLPNKVQESNSILTPKY